MKATLSFCLLAFAGAAASAADPFADSVIEYLEGADVTGGFNDPATALGEPTRVTTAFGTTGDVTPFFPAGGTTDVVSIGRGGSLTVRFDEPVTDDPNNPFGIDLLVFGNAFAFASDFPVEPTSTVTGVFNEGGQIFLSDDGVTFVEAVGIDADSLFPTVGFQDFELGAAGGLADFTLPVDPAYDPLGDTPSEIYAAYDGSGGGAGIDIGEFGLSSVSYVRVSNPVDGIGVPEIDGFADVRAVPEPAAAALALLALAAFGSRRP